MKNIIKFMKDLDLKELIRVQEENEAEEREYLGFRRYPRRASKIRSK